MQDIHYKTLYDTELGHWWYRVRRGLVHDTINAHRKKSHDASRTILDIGCGTGALLKELERYGVCVGLDVSEQAVSFCKERGIENVSVGDIQDLPYKDYSFDIVCALDVIEHVVDDGRALEEIRRVLKPEGIAIITVPSFMFLWGVTDEVSHHYRRYRQPELLQKISVSGLSCIQSSYFNTFLFFPIAVVRLLVRVFSIPVQSENGTGKGFFNTLFYLIFSLERHMLRHVNFPFGVSIITICKK